MLMLSALIGSNTRSVTRTSCSGSIHNVALVRPLSFGLAGSPPGGTSSRIGNVRDQHVLRHRLHVAARRLDDRRLVDAIDQQLRLVASARRCAGEQVDVVGRGRVADVLDRPRDVGDDAAAGNQLRVVDFGIVDLGVVHFGIVDFRVVDLGIVDLGIADDDVVDFGVVDSGLSTSGLSTSGFSTSGLSTSGL